MNPSPSPPLHHREHAHQLKERLTFTMKKFLVMFLYLYLVLGLFALHEYVVLKQHNLAFTNFGWAFANALVMAKVMLVAEEMRLGGSLEDRPLFYLILGKSLVFAIVLIGFRVTESILTGLWHGKTAAESMPSIGGGGLIGIVLAAVIVSVSLVPFFALNELTEMVDGQLYRLIFTHGRRDIAIELKPRSASAR